MATGLYKDCVTAARVSAMYHPITESKRFVAKTESELEQVLDNLIQSGEATDMEEIKRLGKRIVDMCKPVTSETYARVCKKYLKLITPDFEFYKRIKDIVEYEEKFRER